MDYEYRRVSSREQRSKIKARLAILLTSRRAAQPRRARVRHERANPSSTLDLTRCTDRCTSGRPEFPRLAAYFIMSRQVREMLRVRGISAEFPTESPSLAARSYVTKERLSNLPRGIEKASDN